MSFFVELIREVTDSVALIGSRGRIDEFNRELEAQRARDIDARWEALQSPHGSNRALYDETKRLIDAAQFPTPDLFARRLVRRFIEQCEKELGYFPRYNFIPQIAGAAAHIYVLEGFSIEPLNPADFSQHGASAAIGIMRDYLLLMQRKAASPAETLEALYTTICGSFIAITRLLPAIAREAPEGDPDINDTLSIPLLDVIPNMGAIVEAAFDPFSNGRATDLGLYRRVRAALVENLNKLGSRVTHPSDYRGSAQEIANAYLADTPFHSFFCEGLIPFELPDEQRFAGHWIIAPPGRGKTTLLHSMVREDLLKEGACVILMDSKGDLIAPIRELKELEDRLIVIDPDPEHPIAINPLDIPKTEVSLAVSNLEYIFASLLEVKMTPNQTVLFRSVLRALITAFPNPTFETFRDIIQNGIDKYREYINKLPQDLQDFFYKEFNSKVYESRRPEIIWRIRLLLENDAMRGMLLAAKTRFNIAEAMDNGKVVVINNSKARLGDQGAEFFGRFFIAQVLAAAQARAGRREDQKRPVYFYIDECQNVISRDERILTILDECRSQKVALILAHQRTEQIKSADVLSALSNCAIRYANSDDEARYLAPRLRTNQAFLESLPRGQFAVFVRDLTTSAIAISVPRVDFSEFPRFSVSERQAFMLRMRDAYGTPSIPAEMTTQQRAAAQEVPEALAPVTEQTLKRLTLEEARKALQDAIKAADWAKAGELQHSIIPDLERKSPPSEPRPAPASPDLPRPAATSRNEPPDEGTTEWR